jgi:outer membrane biosynthesis protein TonB
MQTTICIIKCSNMKKAIFFLLVISSVTVNVNGQKLKDLLYGGKLKNDSGTVIRKTDDLSAKIDTTTKKPAEPEKIAPTAATTAAGDSTMKKTMPQTDVSSPAIPATDNTVNNNSPRDNNKIWKEYMDSVVSNLKTEVLPNKKIKNGAYYVMLEYEIGPDGQVTINSVATSPENSLLQQQVKDRLTLTAPQMNPPAVSTTGKPRNAVKKYNFTITKM